MPSRFGRPSRSISRTSFYGERGRNSRKAAVALAASALLLCGAPASAQSYDSRTESPLTLLEAPEDGLAYYRTLTRARTLFAAGQYAEAETLAEWLTREYPRDGENWILLGRIKARLQKPAESAAAYERAGPIVGWGLWSNARIYAAAGHLAAGNRRAALELLRAEIYENRSVMRHRLYDWPEFAALRDNPAFRDIVGRPERADLTTPAVRLLRFGVCCRTFERRGLERADRSDRFFGMIRDLFQPIARSERNARGIASTSP